MLDERPIQHSTFNIQHSSHAPSPMPHYSYLHAPNTTSDRLHCSGPVGFSEHCRPGHEDGRTGIDDQRRGARIDAAVDFDLDVESLVSDESRDLTNLRHNRFYELLPAEAGVDGHGQNVVAEL